MNVPLSAALAAALALAATPGSATVIHSAYTPLGSNSWLVDFTLTNDGTPASFAGFTVSLPDASNLVLVQAPVTWDSLVAQPDPALPDAGFLDAFAISPVNYLATGASLGGFRLSFTSTAGTPGTLPFVINSADFSPLFFGTTTVSVVPEPTTAWLALFGLALAGAGAARGRTIQPRRQHTQELAA